MAYVRLDSSILDLPDDAGPWEGMSCQEIADAQAAQVKTWNDRLSAEIEQRRSPTAGQEVMSS